MACRPARYEAEGSTRKPPAGHGRATEEHAETHAVAIGQRKLDKVIEIQQYQPRADDKAHFAVAPRVGDFALIQQLGLAVHRLGEASLHRMHAEADEVTTARCNLLEVECMQAGGAGTGIHLRLDPWQTEVGQ